MSDDVRIITWDWRQQPDVLAIVSAALAMRTAHGDVYVANVDTGSDEYAVCITGHPVDAADINHLYRRHLVAGDE